MVGGFEGGVGGWVGRWREEEQCGGHGGGFALRRGFGRGEERGGARSGGGGALVRVGQAGGFFGGPEVRRGARGSTSCPDLQRPAADRFMSCGFCI